MAESEAIYEIYCCTLESPGTLSKNMEKKTTICNKKCNTIMWLIIVSSDHLLFIYVHTTKMKEICDCSEDG